MWSLDNRTTLKRTLKPHWVWAVALGSSIGWGAFVQPVNWMSTSGPIGAVIGFSIGALLMMIIAVSYGFLIRTFPVSGGEFAYTYYSLGRTHAFISGWFLTLGYACIVALNASALALIFKYIFPTILENLFMYQIAGWDVYFVEIIIATLFLVIFGYFNIKGSGFSGRLQFTFCVIMVLAVFLIFFMTGAQPDAGFFNVRPYFPEGVTSIGAILSIVAIAPWAYVGFDNIPQVAEEFNFPAKKAFVLIITALLFSGLLYALMILSTSMASPWEGLVEAGHVWGTGVAIQDLLGDLGVVILIIALLMGIFTGLNGFIVSTSRLLFAMSRAKFIPKAFGKVHSKYNTPHISIVFTIVISMLAPWFGREALTWIVDMSSIGVTIAYFYACYTAYSMFRWSDSNRQNVELIVDPIKKLLAGLGMFASLVFLSLLLIPGSPAFLGVESRIALIGWIILGLIFYITKRKELNSLPKEELDYLILGEDGVNFIKNK